MAGRIRQSVARWCFGSIPMETFAPAVARMGLRGIEFASPAEWPILKANGLLCTMIMNTSIEKGLNRKENHAECLAALSQGIEQAAENGFPNVVCFSGNRAGLPDDVGLENCAAGLKQIAALAERKKVTLCLELLNSKRDHKDYQFDRTAWGVEVCRRVGSPRVKILYDIYHAQIMEGDVIQTVRENIQFIGHFHTAGVPGRSEIDETQELNYPAIMRVIADLGFGGFVGQEFMPKGDPLASLAQAVRLCDV